jgi:hypothetical protein
LNPEQLDNIDYFSYNYPHTFKANFIIDRSNNGIYCRMQIDLVQLPDARIVLSRDGDNYFAQVQFEKATSTKTMNIHHRANQYEQIDNKVIRSTYNLWVNEGNILRLFDLYSNLPEGSFNSLVTEFFGTKDITEDNLDIMIKKLYHTYPRNSDN